MKEVLCQQVKPEHMFMNKERPGALA